MPGYTHKKPILPHRVFHILLRCHPGHDSLGNGMGLDVHQLRTDNENVAHSHNGILLICKEKMKMSGKRMGLEMPGK